MAFLFVYLLIGLFVTLINFHTRSGTPTVKGFLFCVVIWPLVVYYLIKDT